MGIRRFLILLCVSIPSFMLNLDSNIVAVSLHSIAQSLHADFYGVEWVISAYLLTFASLVMPAGALADRYGRKRILLIGLGLFTAASLACGAASSVVMLNWARAIQGVGAALQLSAALATLSHVFRGPARAKAFAFWGAVIGIAVAVGPVAGGFITETFGWEWAFYINIPIGIVMMLITWRVLDESRDPLANRVDIPGVVLFAGALCLLTLALISGNRSGWRDLTVLSELAASTVLFAAFLVAESVQERPMLDLRFFSKPTYIGANIAALAFAATLLTMLTYLPIYFQSALGYGPHTAGLLMLPMAIPLFVVPRVVASYFTHTMSGRALLTIGLVAVAVGLGWTAVAAPTAEYSKMLGGMIVAGIGAGVLNGEVAKVGMTVIPAERAGMASGVAGTLRMSGVVVGFALLGAILVARISERVNALLPRVPPDLRTQFITNIVAGKFIAITLPGMTGATSSRLALKAFSSGYQAIFLSAAAAAAISALLAWCFVRYEETKPTI